MKSMYLMITLLVGVSSVCAMDEIKKPTANRFGSRSMPLLKIVYSTQASSSDESQRAGSPYAIKFKEEYEVREGITHPVKRDVVIDRAAILKEYSDKRYSSSQSLPTIPEAE
ncbi:MAG: hypothetical protein M1114_04935 [Candidatus Dependentiae bacterium]|nr:hypothetical protein [Candidatus Dependentiae bacterium]